VDIVLMRVIWLAIAICTGVGFLVYLGAWIIVPSDRGFLGDEARLNAPQTN
jgi:phage shock protein PspC (stress-responsive transcriptional regulator)